MTEQPWFADLVVYQVWPRSFADGDGDGVGDLRGVIDHLDHLQWLGVDVLWLSPVYASPMADNGYDISDYRAIDPVFGTLDDLDELVADLHGRGMRLVMDLVVNHTSDQHAWFRRSRAKDAPERGWYWWRAPREGFAAGEVGAEPTDWRSVFSGPAWTLDEASGEYYLHLFASQQPDLNWENPDVRAAVVEMVRWWLDRGVDGFRMDVVNFLSKDVAPDGSLPDAGEGGDAGRFFTDGPRIHEYLAQVRREAYAGYDRPLLAIAEMPGVTVEQALLYTDPARAEVDMVFQFEHVYVDRGESTWDLRPLDLRDLKASLGRWQDGLAQVGWNSLYLGNHDQTRVLSRWGDDGEHRVASAKTLATVLHLQRGTPFVYQGDELGMTNIAIASREDLDDVQSLRYLDQEVAAGRDEAEVIAQIAPASRDNARSPVLWDTSENAGFTTGTPWFPVHGDPQTTSAAVQREDPASVLAHHRALIALRHDEPAVALGDQSMVAADHRWVYAYTRHHAHEGAATHLLVLASFSSEEQDLAPVRAQTPDADAWTGAESVLGTHPAPGAALPDGWPWTPLAPWESRVLRRRS